MKNFRDSGVRIDADGGLIFDRFALRDYLRETGATPEEVTATLADDSKTVKALFDWYIAHQKATGEHDATMDAMALAALDRTVPHGGVQ
jgi:hypothetical protein